METAGSGRGIHARGGINAVLKKRATNYGMVIWSVLFLLFAELDRPNRLEEPDGPDPRHSLLNVGLQT